MAQVWDINQPAPAALGGPFGLITASNAVHTCTDLASTLQPCPNVLVRFLQAVITGGLFTGQLRPV